MGIDPTNGILNWSRHRRLNDDKKIDNSAIEIIRCGDGVSTPDVQVAEYASPLTAEDIVPIAVLLGRLYCGNSESGEALCIIETSPGPGMLTHQGMVQKHGYTNMWRWEYLNTLLPTVANSYGWSSNLKTLDYLWNKFSRHYGRKLLTIRSRALKSEMDDLHVDPKKTFPQPTGEMTHDDRVRAIAMACWAARDWILGDEQIPEPTRIGGDKFNINPQASDMTSEELNDLWEEQWSALLDGN